MIDYIFLTLITALLTLSFVLLIFDPKEDTHEERAAYEAAYNANWLVAKIRGGSR